MANVTQRNFAGGELSSSLYGRTDVVKYQTGLRKCRNFIVQRHGGVTNRPGTEYIGTVKDSTVTARLIRFAFNTSQTYVLEFGNLYMRVIKNGAYLGAPYELVTPYTTAELPDLQYVQTADVITLVHPAHVPHELRRTGDTAWTITPIVFTPSVDPPTAITIPAGGAVGPELSWAVTSIKAETGEESLPLQGLLFSNHVPTDSQPTTITWTPPAQPVQAYNIYRSHDFGSTYGWVGYALTNVFVDKGDVPDLLSAPPIARDPFNAVDKYPAIVSFFQQRRLFAQSNLEPEKIWGSRIGHYNNFTTTFPVQDDDAVTFNLSGRQVNAVKHLIDIGKLIIFTEDGEWLVEGDQAGILRPGEINPRQVSYNGASKLAPVIIGDSPIYVQARGTKVRDFRPNPVAEYPGNDLTVFAAHLFDGYSLVDMDFQENPQSVLWAVRSDGKLLGLTYLPEHAVWGWHWHDTDGTVENVCVVPEGAEDKLYIIVKRTINGVVKRYVERLSARFFTNIRSVILMDSALSYDGRNSTAITMTLSGGVAWLSTETLTITASVAFFGAGDVGNAIYLYDPTTSEEIRFTLEGFTSNVIMTGKAHKTVPASLRNSAQLVWSRAVDSFSGLAHLEGKNVSVIGDGIIIASPNNADYAVHTVVAGAITLDRPYAVVHVGLPYISDFETLDIDTPSGTSLKESKILVNKVRLVVEKSRGIWSGRHEPTGVDPLLALNEVKPPENADPFLPPELVTDDVEVTIESNWDSNGRIFVRQVDPVPLTILAAIPQGFIP